MQNNLRQAERITLLTQPKGKLYLNTMGECYPVSTILNVSPVGISIQLKNIVDVAAEIEIQYKTGDIDLRVNGFVVWNRKTVEPNAAKITDCIYEIGINLLSPHLLMLMLQPESKR